VEVNREGGRKRKWGLEDLLGQARRLVQSSSRPVLGGFVHRGSGISYWFGCISFDFLQISQGRARGFLDEEEHKAFPNTFVEFTLLIHVDSPFWKAYVFTGTLLWICNSQERVDSVLQEVLGGRCTFKKVIHVHSRFLGFHFYFTDPMRPLCFHHWGSLFQGYAQVTVCSLLECACLCTASLLLGLCWGYCVCSVLECAILCFVAPAVICLVLCTSGPTPQDQCICAHRQWGKTVMLGCSFIDFACVFLWIWIVISYLGSLQSMW
jgi:hypothetical protein